MSMRKIVALVVLVLAGCSNNPDSAAAASATVQNKSTAHMTIAYLHYGEPVDILPGLDPQWTKGIHFTERDGYSVLNVDIDSYLSGSLSPLDPREAFNYGAFYSSSSTAT